MTPYQQRVIEQTRLWAQGTPKHNTVDEECCPDFSCCVPEMFTKDAGRRNEQYLKMLEQYRQVQ